VHKYTESEGKAINVLNSLIKKILFSILGFQAFSEPGARKNKQKIDAYHGAEEEGDVWVSLS
jgi:hypothetical protein